MTYIVTALLAEAHFFIQHYQLVLQTKKPFLIYENNQIRLIIAGTGKIAASIATTYLILQEDKESEIKVFNIGTCTSKDSAIMIGSLHPISKIIESTTHKVYHLEESGMALTCVDMPLDDPNGIKTPLADMESVGVYLACKRFKVPLKLFKIVSDHTHTTLPKAEEIHALFYQQKDSLLKALS